MKKFVYTAFISMSLVGPASLANEVIDCAKDLVRNEYATNLQQGIEFCKQYSAPEIERATQIKRNFSDSKEKLSFAQDLKLAAANTDEKVEAARVLISYQRTNSIPQAFEIVNKYTTQELERADDLYRFLQNDSRKITYEKALAFAESNSNDEVESAKNLLNYNYAGSVASAFDITHWYSKEALDCGIELIRDGYEKSIYKAARICAENNKKSADPSKSVDATRN